MSWKNLYFNSICMP